MRGKSSHAIQLPLSIVAMNKYLSYVGMCADEPAGGTGSWASATLHWPSSYLGYGMNRTMSSVYILRDPSDHPLGFVDCFHLIVVGRY